MNAITYHAWMKDATKDVWSGDIIPIRLKYQPYEFEVKARGSYFHLLIGSHAYGNFICIPNWNVGTELSSLSDLFWNCERLSKTNLKNVDACSVAYALQELSNYINL